MPAVECEFKFQTCETMLIRYPRGHQYRRVKMSEVKPCVNIYNTYKCNMQNIKIVHNKHGYR